VSVDDPTTGQTSRQAAVIGQEHGLCDGCRGTVEHTVNDLTETWLALHLAIGDTGRRLNQKVTISRAAPINLNTDADALKVAIVEWVSAAAARVAEQLNIQHDDDRPGVEARNSTDAEAARVMIACTRLLAPNIDRLLEQPHDDVMVWLTGKETQYAGERLYVDDQGISHVGVRVTSMSGAEIGLKLVELRRKARSLLALTATNDKLSFPCPRCNQYELTRTHRQLNTVNGEQREIDEIGCGSCKFNRSYAHYQNLCAIWVKEDEMEREKLQKQLDAEKERREMAEWLLARREWQLGLALDCTDVSAADYAATILANPNTPDPDAKVSDKDAANLIGVSDSTIRNWASKGAITRHTADDGSVVFDAGEVWAFAKTVAGGRTATNRRLSTARKLNEPSPS
jgi:transcription elongation factor Elf1